jgi:MFS family permease
MIGVLYVIFLACLTTITVHVVIHATGLGVNVAKAANILAIVGVLSIFGNNVIGTASDKIGNRMALATSFILMSVALFLIIIARDAWTLYLFAAVFGFSFGGMQVVFSPIIAELFGLKAHGTLLAAANFIGQIGAAGGPVVSGHIFDALNSYNMAFIICAAMSIVAIVITLLLRPVGDMGDARIN